jgi:hypothetical protein
MLLIFPTRRSNSNISNADLLLVIRWCYHLSASCSASILSNLVPFQIRKGAVTILTGRWQSRQQRYRMLWLLVIPMKMTSSAMQSILPWGTGGQEGGSTNHKCLFKPETSKWGLMYRLYKNSYTDHFEVCIVPHFRWLWLWGAVIISSLRPGANGATSHRHRWLPLVAEHDDWQPLATATGGRHLWLNTTTSGRHFIVTFSPTARQQQNGLRYGSIGRNTDNTTTTTKAAPFLGTSNIENSQRTRPFCYAFRGAKEARR